MFGGGFVAIPSSKCEFLCVQWDGEPDQKDLGFLRDAIGTINDCGYDEIIQKKDVLAYAPLWCDAKTLELTELKEVRA